MKIDIEYKTIYLKDLFQLIDSMAINCMMIPLNAEKRSASEMDKVSRINNDIAWNNEGVRDLATRLKQALLGEDEQDDE